MTAAGNLAFAVQLGAVDYALPLLHNLHVCEQVLRPGAIDNPSMIRLDPSGAVIQSTFLGAAPLGSLVHTADGGRSALGKVSGEDSFAYAPSAVVQVLSLGLSPNAQPMMIGCMVDLARAASSAASPGLLFAVNIENDAANGPVSAHPDSAGRFPTSLGGVTITFDGVAAPLFALTGQQLRGAVPFSVAGSSTVQMCLTSFSAPPSCTAIQVLPFGPAVWSLAGSPMVINENGTINSADHPAPPGSIVTFYLIGLGPLSPAVPDGMIVGPPFPAFATQVQVQFFTKLGVRGQPPPHLRCQPRLPTPGPLRSKLPACTKSTRAYPPSVLEAPGVLEASGF